MDSVTTALELRDPDGRAGGQDVGAADADYATGNRPTAPGQDYPRPPVADGADEFVYNADQPPDVKFRLVGKSLRKHDDLYRNPETRSGLVLVIPGDNPRQVTISTGTDLQAVINDRVRIIVVADGKPKGGRIPPAELASMLKSEVFLQEFPPLDRVVGQPLFLPDWVLTRPGYNDGGRGQRFYFAGGEALVYREPDAIRRFLDAMPFQEEADRTNAVAGALTVLLRNHWPGRKPFFPVTANRSHAGKGTLVAFMTGGCEAVQVTYESTEWAFQKSVTAALLHCPDLGVLNVDNVRVDGNGGVVRSAYLERMLHETRPTLYSPGAKDPVRTSAHFVVTATANDGRFNEDLMNRACPIRLQATGDLTRRTSPIGDPKGDFLPRNRVRIEGELRGMVENWKAADRPVDPAARHPSFPEWAAAVGGILKVSGFGAFLANQATRRSEDDPVRRALATLGAAYPGEWLRTEDWAGRVAKLDLSKLLITAADRDSPVGRVRGVGVSLSNHAGETLVADSEDESVVLTLEKRRRRFDGGEPQTRYRFEVVGRRPVPADPG